MKKFTTILMMLILFSCTNNEKYTKESWSKMSNSDANVLTKEIYYSQDNKRLMDVIYQPSGQIKTMLCYDTNENVKAYVSYYDSTLQKGMKCVKAYHNGNVIEEKYTHFSDQSEEKTITVSYINTTNDNDDLMNTLLVYDKDTTQIIYTYLANGLLETQSMIEPSGDLQMIIKNQYDSLENVVLRIGEFPIKNEIHYEICNYKDTLLQSKLFIKNNDTIRQQKYIYHKGVNTEIETIDQNGRYKEIMVKDMVAELPTLPLGVE